HELDAGTVQQDQRLRCVSGRYSGPGGRAYGTIGRDTDRRLEPPDGPADPIVDSRVKRHKRKPGIKSVSFYLVPVIPLVDVLRLLERQGNDIDSGIGAFADAVFGFSAGIGRVVHVAAFVADDYLEHLVVCAHGLFPCMCCSAATGMLFMQAVSTGPNTRSRAASCWARNQSRPTMKIVLRTTSSRNCAGSEEMTLPPRVSIVPSMPCRSSAVMPA